MDGLKFDALEAAITVDPGGRGLASSSSDNLVKRCRGHLAAAAEDLAAHATSVALVTGFYVKGPRGATVETDGLTGTLALAWVLSQLGAGLLLVVDPLGRRAIEVGMQAAGLKPAAVDVVVFPFESDDPADPARCSNEPHASARSLEFAAELLERCNQSVSHIVAIERAGPSHTLESAAAVAALEATSQSHSDLALFERLCPSEHQNQVHNCAGQIITPWTAKTHFLFEPLTSSSKGRVRTIGIGDGGNEIGMGIVPWYVVQENISSGLGARIACRIGTDWCIVAGVSNWGAFALAAAVARLAGRAELAIDWAQKYEFKVLESLVKRAGVVDGITGQPTPTVDGLPIDTYMEKIQQIADCT